MKTIYEFETPHTLDHEAEVDGAWYLLSEEDRVALEALGWVDGVPPTKSEGEPQ